MGLSRKVVLQIKEIVKECMAPAHAPIPYIKSDEPLIGPETNKVEDYLGKASEEEKQFFLLLSPDAQVDFLEALARKRKVVTNVTMS